MSDKGFLKQSTSATIHIGPFLDNTDGDTEENALSITKADIFISKNSAALATKNDSSSAASDTLSFYTTSINATDTDTLGRLQVSIHKSGSLLCSDTYTILNANNFDSFILGSDRMQVDTREYGDSNLALTTQMKADVNIEVDSALATMLENNSIATNVWNAAKASYNVGDSFGEEVQLHSLSSEVAAVAATIGSPISIDSSATTLSGMLVKVFDDSDGASYDATTDSLKTISDSIVALTPLDTVANAGNITTGTNISGDYTDTQTLNSVYWQNTPTGSAVLDCDLTFSVGTGRTPDDVDIVGRYQSGSPTGGKYVDTYAYNYSTSSYDGISTIANRMNHSTSDTTYTYTLNTNHIEEGTGNVKIRFLSNNVDNTSNLYLDYVFVTSVAQSGLTTGEIADAVKAATVIRDYPNGIWVDSDGGTDGDMLGENGLENNPVQSMSSATTLANALGIKKISFITGSVATFTQAFSKWTFLGNIYNIDFNNQNIDGSYFHRSSINGTATFTTLPPIFYQGIVRDVTLPPCYLIDQAFADNVAFSENSADYFILNGYSGVAGLDTPSFTLATNSNYNFRNYSGGTEFKTLSTGSSISLEGNGQYILASSCSGGTIAIRGNFKRTDNAGGVVFEDGIARYDTKQINDQVDAGLATWNPPTVDQLVERTLASASYFDAITDKVINVGTVATLSGHTAQTGDNYIIASSATFGNEALATTLEKVEVSTVNKQVIQHSTGNWQLFDKFGASLGTVTGAIATTSDFTTRLRLDI